MTAPGDDLIARLPHHPPMRLVEHVVECVPGELARTTRLARAGDWYFSGHFPGNPVVPAIALVELVAQTGGLAAASGASDDLAPLRIAALTNFKFPAAAGPGALLETIARVVGRMGRLIRIDGSVTADGQLVAIGSVTLADPRAARPDA